MKAAEPVVGPAEVAAIVRRCLAEGSTVQIDGLGVFARTGKAPCVSRPRPWRPFSWPMCRKTPQWPTGLYDRLEAAGFASLDGPPPLLPGQNWPRAIEEAIETSDFFVACFSTRSVAKRGGSKPRSATRSTARGVCLSIYLSDSIAFG